MKTILIIEDDLTAIAFLSRALLKAGYQIQVALNGTDALPLALSKKFDLILLDLGLPGMDGASILCAIRSQRLKTPVIVVTSVSEDIEREQLLILGANEYITKPFLLAHLLTCIYAYA